MSWTVSVVSHGHGAEVARTLTDLHQQLGDDHPHRLILTLNIPEDESWIASLPAALRRRLEIRRNPQARGFGANHNAALQGARSEFILIADPRLRIETPIFAALEDHLEHSNGIVSPQAVDANGQREDNGRAVVSPASLFEYYVLRRPRIRAQSDQCQDVDWLAGLFLAMRADTFQTLGGFNERFFLYVEDADLCIRARLAGFPVQLLPRLTITHQANRDTRRRWKHFFWHCQSLLRLWRSSAYRQFRARAATATLVDRSESEHNAR